MTSNLEMPRTSNQTVFVGVQGCRGAGAPFLVPGLRLAHVQTRVRVDSIAITFSLAFLKSRTSSRGSSFEALVLLQ